MIDLSRLGRRPEFDEKSKDYPIRTMLPSSEIRSWSWGTKTSLDQGYDGACVGFAFTHELMSYPSIVEGVDAKFAKELYFDAQRIDPWPGGAYDGSEEFYEGTSVLAGAKVLKDRDYYQEYRWGFGINDVLGALSHTGPVVIGTNWYEDMFSPDANGIITVSGNYAGGHAYLLNANNVQQELVRVHNSWGPNWSVGGYAYMRYRDLERLLNEDGEACIPITRRPLDSSIRDLGGRPQ